jgi:hypothetical protein
VSDERGPIFIGGLSLSGKTQLRVVLGAHPEISMTRRTYMWDRFYQRFGDLGKDGNLDRCLSAMLATEGIRRLEPDPRRIRTEFLDGPPTYARLFALFHQHHAGRVGKRRWGDQLGFVERFADPIFASYPSARMIHMIRDPRAPVDPGARIRRRRRGSLGWSTARWRHSAELAERNGTAYPDRYRVVRYEQLASRPEETVREVCAFLDEEYVNLLTEAIETITFDTNDGTGELAEHASIAERTFVEAHANRELLAFDYLLTPTTPRENLSFRLVDHPMDRAAMLAWRVLGNGLRVDRERGRA